MWSWIFRICMINCTCRNAFSIAYFCNIFLSSKCSLIQVVARNRTADMHILTNHDDVIKWKHFPRYWSFVRGIHRSPVNSPHKGQWRGALMFTLICARINDWVNNGEAGDLRRNRAHYDVIIMITFQSHTFLDSKVHGANVGSTWVMSAPDGPHVGPMNLATRVNV